MPRTAAARPLEVGVDARGLNSAQLRGMGKYLHALISRLSDARGIRWHLWSDRPDLPMHVPAADNVTVDRFEMRGFRFHAWEQLALPARARGAGADVLHCPGGRLPWWQPVPTIVTLHDAMPWLLPEPDWRPGWYRDAIVPRALRKCAAVITVSESSRRDIVALWPELLPKIHVIPNGVDDEYLRAAPGPPGPALQRAGVRQPYLLYLGGHVPRKRLDWALRTFARVADTGVSLVICGLGQEPGGVIERLAPDLRSRVVLLPFVPEAEMPGLYLGAAAVLYPTEYEGFGLPALEAQAVGAPVLFSDVSSLTELQGPGSHVLPAQDLDAWASTARALIEQRRSGARPDERSRAWARGYSWDACAARTLAVYADIAARRQLAPGPALSAGPGTLSECPDK